MSKRNITPYGMSDSDYQKFCKNTERFLYSKSPYIRLTSLLIFFDVNIDCLCNDVVKIHNKPYDKTKYETNEKAKYDLMNRMSQSNTNFAIINDWYKDLANHLNNYNEFTCHKCLLDAIYKAKNDICNDSKCEIVQNYDTYIKFFSKFYENTFDSLKEKDNEFFLYFNNYFQQFFESTWEKYLIMHFMLPQYKIKVPSKESFLLDMLKKNHFHIYKDNLLKNLTDNPKNNPEDETIFADFCKEKLFEKIMSSIRINWKIISKIHQNNFLADKLIELLRNGGEHLKKIEEKNPDLKFTNAVKYAYLLNYRVEKRCAKSTTIKKFFLDKCNSEQETALFCLQIIIILCDVPDLKKRLTECFKLLFYYACTYIQ